MDDLVDEEDLQFLKLLLMPRNKFKSLYYIAKALYIFSK
jgi:hypothetical protein